MLLLLLSCEQEPGLPVAPAVPTNEALARACEENGGPGRVEAVADGVFVARGFDLANTIAVSTPEGVVVIDPGMTVQRARLAREALSVVAPGPVLAVIYTHGHLDHVGGAAAWAGPDTPIWATETMSERFYARYDTLLPAERARASRQFGQHLGEGCSALGPRPELEAPGPVGAMLPTHTFQGSTALELGGVELSLVQAPGETEDHLFVWLPEQEILLCGDNWYPSFPNLYTLRGTRPRPVDAWIDSLDAMRRLEPMWLVPSHTAPVQGKDAVQHALVTHRDAIQYVRDAVIRGANRGDRLEALVRSVQLPPHLRAEPALAEIYGQVDWSVKGIYGGELGWFDGRATELYPLPDTELATRSLAAMGGAERVLEQARQARAEEPRWSAHLLALLEDAGALDNTTLDAELALTYEAIAGSVHNANGRSYLLEAALERRGLRAAPLEPELPEPFVAQLPLEVLFHALTPRLRAAETLSLHESVVFDLTERGSVRRFVVTIRRGVVEIVEGEALPGTPPPLARVVTDAQTWRQLAVGHRSAPAALVDGSLQVEGSKAGLVSFLGRFDREPPRPETLP